MMIMLKDNVEPSDMEQGMESGLRAFFGQQSVKKKNVVEFMMKAWVHVSKQNQAFRGLKS